MQRSRLILPMLLLGLVGILWGCAPAPQQPPVADKSVDARVTKLERELKTMQESSNALAAQIKVEQGRVVAEQARTADVEKEREDVKAQLKAKHAERDLVQSQYDGFRKGMRELLAQADAAAGVKPTGETPAIQPVAQK